MSSERPVITFDAPADFVDFVRRHGLTSPREEGPVVFKLEEDIALPHQLRSYDDDQECPSFVRYQAPVQIFDKIGDARFDAQPQAPRYWRHNTGATIWRQLSAKRDVISALSDMGVAQELLKKFDRVRTSELRELVDSSPSDNSNVEEILSRRTVTPPDTLIFKLKDSFADEIRVTVSKERGSETLNYTLTADYSRHWTARETAIKATVEAAKFKVYAGSMG
jgi:hypothetical protein